MRVAQKQGGGTRLKVGNNINTLHFPTVFGEQARIAKTTLFASPRRESSSHGFFSNIFFQKAGHWRPAADFKCSNIILSIEHIF